MGGVFFIDEAYDLDPKGDFKGKPIVSELLVSFFSPLSSQPSSADPKLTRFAWIQAWFFEAKRSSFLSFGHKGAAQ